MSTLEKPPSDPQPRPRRDLAPLTVTALALVILASSWYLLTALAGLFRPLLLAVFLCYVILPIHLRLKRHIPSLASFGVITAGSVALLLLVVVIMQGSIAGLYDDMPRLTGRARAMIEGGRQFVSETAPWLVEPVSDPGETEKAALNQLHSAMRSLVESAAELMVEAIEVGFFLIFLLWEATRLPPRVRSAFPSERAEHILAVVQRINSAMASYLTIKVKTSLGIAATVTVALWLFGVKLPLLWGLITFFGNFIPYVGSIVTCGVAALFALLDLEPGWTALTAVAALILIHVLWRDILEPMMTGKEVDLSPVVILAAISFWGIAWGLTGMVLSVPLTVMFKIILENVSATRPLGRMMAEE